MRIKKLFRGPLFVFVICLYAAVIFLLILRAQRINEKVIIVEETITGPTYGSDSSISDAELFTIDVDAWKENQSFTIFLNEDGIVDISCENLQMSEAAEMFFLYLKNIEFL